MTDNHSPFVRSYNMSHIGSRNTKPEDLVLKYLFSQGFRYRRNDKRYSGKPDAVFPKYKTVIFVNGCFWHSHEGCSGFVMPKSRLDYWQPKLERNKKRDADNIMTLQAEGWHVIVVWECELTKTLKDERLKLLCDELTSNK